MVLDKIKKDVLKYIEDMGFDVTQLESYKYTSAIIDYDNGGEPADDSWDTNEEFNAKVEKFLGYLETDDLGEYVEISKTEEDLYKTKIICWLNSIKD